MDGHPNARGTRLVGLVGLLIGALAGATAFVAAGAAIVQPRADSSRLALEATHVPPLLTTSNERIELRYDVYCVDPDAQETDDPCDLAGSVFIRPGVKGDFREISLREDGPTGSPLVALVPEAIAASSEGFTYYAKIVARSGQAAVTLPAGGASAPHRSLPLEPTVDVDLGQHRFGEPSRADERVAEAAWGAGPNEVGLEQGRNLAPVGASAFDVDERGVVVLLDQAHRRVLRWRRDSRAPTRIPLSISGTLADISLSPDGTMYVLEFVSRHGQAALVRRFDSAGGELEATEIAERTPSQIRQGPSGPIVLQHPSGQWMPIASGSSPAAPDTQLRLARSGRPLRGGDEVVVLRSGNEIRVALVGSAGIRRSWRVSSKTSLAEVQLAEPMGRHFVLVVRVFTDSEDEFVALVLGDKGLVRQVSLAAADWAESAPLGRFRLAGSSLYQLGSTSTGAFVDRFDLEVR